MAKTILGVDIGQDQLKLALVKGKTVLKTATAEMPENLLREGRVASRETMGELIRTTMKEHGIRASRAALVLPMDVVFIKNVDVPPMSAEQLQYNLPFEFKDYITGELREYVFDYAVVSDPEDERSEEAPKEAVEDTSAEEAPPATLEVMAVGTQRAVLEDAQEFLRKAGMKLVKSAPGICSYIALLRAQYDVLPSTSDEYGILDLGYSAIRMHMFHKDKYVATRALEVGLNNLDDVLVDVYGVDRHMAHTYLMSNFENCQHREECMAAYENIAVELMRALNFYRFSNPNSALSDIWLCGGGAVIQPLAETIGDMLNIQLHTADELVPGGEMIDGCNSYVQAIGITMD